MKTTRPQFVLFEKECKYWEKIFELNGWEIDYNWVANPSGSVAWTKRHLKSRTIDVCLNIEWPNYNSITKEEIKLTAKHEMIHCLLAGLSENAYSRFISQHHLYESEEELVHKLIKIIK